MAGFVVPRIRRTSCGDCTGPPLLNTQSSKHLRLRFCKAGDREREQVRQLVAAGAELGSDEAPSPAAGAELGIEEEASSPSEGSETARGEAGTGDP